MKNNILKNVSYLFSSNFLNLIASFFLIMFVPKFIGVESYGYWQLYMFYITYLQYCTLGIPEGIYLEFGGYDYDMLEKKRIRNQYLWLTVITLIISITLLFFSNGADGINNFQKQVILLSSISLVLIVPRSVLTYTLQTTNKIKAFSTAMILEKVTLIIGVLLLIVFRKSNFIMYITVDIFSKFFANIFLLITCRGFFSLKNKPSQNNFLLDSFYFSKIGINITLSNLSSILVLGIVRFYIERFWNIIIFGQISLLISLINMVLVFINSISIIFFPILKNLNEIKAKRIFSIIDEIVEKNSIILLFFYFPIYVFTLRFLPNYADALVYLGLLYPMVIFESQVVMIYTTMYKVLRLEKKLLQINFAIVIFAIVTLGANMLFFESLKFSVSIITFSSVIKVFLFKKELSKFFNEKSKYNDFLVELIVMILFMITTAIDLSILWILFINCCLILSVIMFNYKSTKRKVVELKKIIHNFNN